MEESDYPEGPFYYYDYDAVDENFVPPCYSAMERGWTNATLAEMEAYQRYDFFSWLTNGVLTCPLVLLGCIGNIYSIWVMRRNKKLRDTIALHLSTLAAWDAALLVATFGYYGLASLFVAAIQPWITYKYVAWLLHPVITLTMTASIWMVVLITSERHMAIWRPLSFRSYDTIGRARLIVFLIGVFTMAVNLPTVLELEIIECSERNGTMGTELAPTSLRYSMLYNAIYRILCYFLFITVCPFTAILILTIRMIYLVRKAQAECMMTLMSNAGDSAGAKKRRKGELAVTKMLMGITIKFLLCYSLPTSLNIWETSNFLNGDEPSLTFRYFVDVSNLLVILNSATNCLIVIRFHKKKAKPTQARCYELRRLWQLFKRSGRPKDEELITATVRAGGRPAIGFVRSRDNLDSPRFDNTATFEMCHTELTRVQSFANNYDSDQGGYRRRAGTIDSRTGGHFTLKEATILIGTWEEIRGGGLARHILHAFFRCLPDTARHIAAETSQPATPNPCHDDDPAAALLSKSRRLRPFSAEESSLEGVLWCVVSSAGDWEEEASAAERLGRLWELHERAGVVLTNRHWREFKSTVAEASGKTTLSSFPLTEVQAAWNRLACFIIAKVKAGARRPPPDAHK